KELSRQRSWYLERKGIKMHFSHDVISTYQRYGSANRISLRPQVINRSAKH
ncbi:hypothetical protein NDU88_005507, partial [Pleurodeles waltl]